MSHHLLTTASPIALESRRQEHERVALLKLCRDAILVIANQKIAERSLDEFMVVCVDLAPLFQDDVDFAHAHSDPLSTASCVPFPAAIFAATDEIYAELAESFPEQAHDLMRTMPGLLKVIVINDHGATACFMNIGSHAVTKH